MLTIILLGALAHLLMLALLSSGRGDGSTNFSLMNKSGKGGSSTTVVQSSPTPQPSTADAINAWVQSMPQVFAEQQRQAPLEAAQNIALAQQYALPLAQTLQGVDRALYPQTAGLQETMAGQANEGMNATSMPPWMAAQYRDEMKAQLGNNMASPIGADYVSRGMQSQLFNQQKYYRDLGLSLAGRQPLIAGSNSTPQTPNYTSNFSPSSVMSYMQGNYGINAGANRTSTTTNSGGGGLFSMFGF